MRTYISRTQKLKFSGRNAFPKIFLARPGWRDRTAKKVSSVFFRDADGAVLVDFLLIKEKKIMTSPFREGTLGKRRKALAKQRPSKLRTRILLQPDSHIHTVTASRDVLDKLNRHILHYPARSFSLDHTDYFLFPRLKFAVELCFQQSFLFGLDQDFWDGKNYLAKSFS